MQYRTDWIQTSSTRTITTVTDIDMAVGKIKGKVGGEESRGKRDTLSNTKRTLFYSEGN